MVDSVTGRRRPRRTPSHRSRRLSPSFFRFGRTAWIFRSFNEGAKHRGGLMSPRRSKMVKRFLVNLAVSDNPPEPTPEEAPSAEAEHAKFTILAVEDDEAV